METPNIMNENSELVNKTEPETRNLALFSSLRTWTLIVSVMGFITAASYVCFRISLNASPGKWTIEGHLGFAWTNIAEGILMILFLVSVVSLLLFSVQMGKLAKKIMEVDESGLLIWSSLRKLRNHFKFLGITFILIFVAVLYGIL